MKQWSLTLHGPGGILGSFDSGEAQFVIGSEDAADVLRVVADGVVERHAWVWIGRDRMQVEDLGGGTLANGHAFEGRVEVDYPASVQIGDVTLVVEVKMDAASSSGDPSLAVTIPQRGIRKSSPSLDLTVPQRLLPEVANDQRESQAAAGSQNKAPLTGEYTLVREIARGGMGQIYFGEDSQLKRQVAVKVSTVAYGCEDLRFSKEAEVLAHLAHPNIVPIHAMGIDDQGRPFYSMKLVKGRTLQAVLNAIREGDAAALKEYPRAALLTVFRKVCDAMAFAHSKGVLHRDLKPENIMVGEYGEVLVMDWGLAKILGERDVDGERKVAVNDTGDYGMTMEGEVMGTPQYMSPEQAEGVVAELDVRSDIYSLGGILYAVLTLRPPIDGTSLNEVLTKVKSGQISSMATKRGGKPGAPAETPLAMGEEVPEALQAVTLKAMSTDRSKRYVSVESFAADIEAYQNGFATSAEEAGTWKRLRLWVGRNKVLAGAAAAMLVVVSGFTARVIQKGREASEALQSLRETAPTFAVRAQDALRDGNFEDALKAATFAVKLEGNNGEYHAMRGNALQVLMRWPEAMQEYQLALRAGANERAQENLILTEDLISRFKTEGEAKAKGVLFAALNQQGRNYEAMTLVKDMKEFWREQKKDPGLMVSLIKRLEEKLLPIPGTSVLMCKTKITFREWNMYLSSEGLPKRAIPEGLTEEHPVNRIQREEAIKLCSLLSSVSGKKWRLPTDVEWATAAGGGIYPWGDYWPPKDEDGVYSVNKKRETSEPVGTCKPNKIGMLDLGGNAWEWISEYKKSPALKEFLVGGAYFNSEKNELLTLGPNTAGTHAKLSGGIGISVRVVVEK